MVEKRPIDRLRSSAISMEIDDADDGSRISEMISMGGKLLIVKEHSIHAIQLADQIDPERTNARIPNTQQKLLAMGADDPIVARIFLTGHTLFSKTALGQDFDEAKGLCLALALLQSLVAMNGMLIALETAETEAKTCHEQQGQQRRGLLLPSIPELKARYEAFAQKAGHVVNSIEISKLFYAKEISKKWIDSLSALVTKRYGSDSPFSQYMTAVRPFLLFLLDMRNLIEHPKTDRHIAVIDFHLNSSGQIEPPCIEVMRPGEDAQRSTAILLMRKIIDDLTSVSEVMMAHLCNAHVRSFGEPHIFVVELPENQRPNKHQRMFYATIMGGKVVRFG